jgi:hypothetical protein
MPYELHRLSEQLPDASRFESLIERHQHASAMRQRRLWDYYANPMRITHDSMSIGKPYRLAQEWGLPKRLTGDPESGIERKEVSIENDIGWRIDTLVEYLFGKPVVFNSLAPDPARREQIEPILRAMFDHAGGVTLLQQLALLSSIHGFVDVMVKYCPDSPTRSGRPPLHPARSNDDRALPPPAAPETDVSTLERVVRSIRFEIVEPVRALPLLHPQDHTNLLAYALVYSVPKINPSSGPSRDDFAHRAPQQTSVRSFLTRLLDRIVRESVHRTAPEHLDARTLIVDVTAPDAWQRYEDGTLTASGEHRLSRIPLVHIQNTALPFQYTGVSDVEGLIPLQDELNTRLSDRASRITMQSFKMYLARGLDGFNNMPVGPGKMWMTDNENAEVVEFGGDADCPSESQHISDIREAMDKTSGVSPIAAGAIKGRIGRLTSAAALRVTMQSLLAKTERKRTIFTTAIQQLAELAFEWLDRTRTFHTTPDERAISIAWPNPIPVNELERLTEARMKLELGLPRAHVLRDLGLRDLELLDS